MTTNSDVLRLAREIIKTHGYFPPDAVNIGQFDDTETMRIAIAAIERTSELSKDFAWAQLRVVTHPRDKIWNAACTTIAGWLHNYSHLRQPEKGSTDE